MPANWMRVLLVVGVALTGCQSGLFPAKPKGAAATGVATVDSASAPAAAPAVAAKEKEAPGTSAPRFEPGDYVEGYRQPKGSLIPPVLPPGKALQTSVKK